MKKPSSPARQRKTKKKTTAATAQPAAAVAAVARPFPVVGIGASAGGLEALEMFLSNVPLETGMAFVVIQHLDPTREGIMPELLQRATAMKVSQVRDRTPVEPNRIYVIPPNKDLSILHGVLHLLEPASPRGLRLPIDFFFRALAQDREDASIGVILSGMGADGTLGLRAIKEKAGLVLVQDPATARFDGMPRSAIEAGLADIVAPANELPGKIVNFRRRAPLAIDAPSTLDYKSQDALDKAIIVLRSQTGHDFSHYKKETFHRRVQRRMGIHQIDTFADYVRYLQHNSREVDLLFKEILIGVTSFFRDGPSWKYLRDHVLPELFATRPSNHALRVWVPGCSTGEEAYSLAIVFKEALAALKPPKPFTLSLFATDLDKDAIEKARQGVFPEGIAADVSPERLDRFFTKTDGGYRVGGEIRGLVVFAPQSVVLNPPFTKLDLLSCRNLLIYLVPEMQKKLIPLFHFSLNPGGILFLGSAESVGGFTDLFTPIGTKTRLYRRTETIGRREQLEFPATFAPPMPQGTLDRLTIPEPSLQTLAERMVLDRFAAPAVLVNADGDILYVSGHTGSYLEPAAGKANWNVLAMARDGLRGELSQAFHRQLREGGSVKIPALSVKTHGEEHYVDLIVERLEDPEPLKGLVMIVFAAAAPSSARAPEKDGPHPKPAGNALESSTLERKFREVVAELQRTRELMQASQEELRSTNEELQSANEEMQSTNEELTTSKEELQSLNEELQTVNAELQSKLDELARSNTDMRNLLDSTDIATLFLDKHLKVRRFTSQATTLIKLIPGDVGRPITDLGSDLLYPELAQDAREVLRKLGFKEKPIATREGRWFSVRIMPYRTLDDRIDGLVITFTEITVAKKLEAQLRAKQADLEQHVAKQSAEIERDQGREAAKAPAGKRTGKRGTPPSSDRTK